MGISDELWRGVREGSAKSGGPYPSCGHAMRRVERTAGAGSVEVDACASCEIVWFDSGRLAEFSPERQAPVFRDHDLSPRARESLAEARISAQRVGEKADSDAERLAVAVQVLLLLLLG